MTDPRSPDSRVEFPGLSADIQDSIETLKRALRLTGQDLVALANDQRGDETTLRIRIKDIGERLTNL